MQHHSKKIIITGASGLLGNNLLHYFKESFNVLGVYNSNPINLDGVKTIKCNILDKIQLSKIIKDFKPNIIVHCAALSNVDQCQLDKQFSNRINILGTKNIAEIIDEEVNLIYISTDSVYDGKNGHFSENDQINPLNHYGLTKYNGEIEALKHKNSLILRTNFFGWNFLNKVSLVEWVIQNLKENKTINCFHDAYFSSIYTFKFAEIISKAIKKRINGIYNCGSSDSCSKFEFAKKIADKFSFDKSLINSISIEEYNFEAKRGKNQSLNVRKLELDLNCDLGTINESINSCFIDYQKSYHYIIKK